MTCLPCTLKKYDVVCSRCGVGFCHGCFRKTDTGGFVCDASLFPGTSQKWLHSFRYENPEWEIK